MLVWLRRWWLLTALVPLVAWVLDQVREEMERRRGRNRLTGALAQASTGLRDLRRRRRR